MKDGDAVVHVFAAMALGRGRGANRTLGRLYPVDADPPGLSYSSLDPRFAGSNPTGVNGFFSERKNPEYDFLRKGSNAIGPVS